MEKKISWNLYVFESLANRIDQMSRGAEKRNKGTIVSAACLMFLSAQEEDRQRFMDAVALAEVRNTPLLPDSPTPPTSVEDAMAIAAKRAAIAAGRPVPESKTEPRARKRKSA